MSGSASNLPVRIQVEGVPQAEAAFNQIATSGQRAMQRVQQGSEQAAGGTRNLGAAVGQAGFQIQDFATQVSMGQNALTAFSTQASQFLGVFGTGGAIAGAVLTVAALAAQFLLVGRNSEDAQEGIDNFTKSLDASAREAERVVALLARVEARFLSIAERSRTAQLREVTADISALNNEARDATLRLVERENVAGLARRRASGLTGQIADLQNPSASFGGAGVSASEIAALARQRDEALREAAAAEADVRNLQAQVARFDALIGRSEGLLQGLVADGSSANSGTVDREPAASRSGSGGRSATARAAAIERLMVYEEGAPGQTVFPIEVMEIAERNMRNLQRETERTSDVTRQLGFTFNSAFEDALIKGKSLSGVLQSIGEDLARIIIRQSITTPLANSANALLQPFVNSAAGFFSGMFSPTATPAVAGARAGGGPVYPGSAYLIGERGPEFFVPNQSGAVLPNGVSPGGMVINHSPVFQISGGGGLSSQQRAEALALAQMANADLLSRINRGGSAARVVGRR